MSVPYLVFTSHVEGAVDPTIVIQNFAGHAGAGLAVDGVTKVLFGNSDQAGTNENGHGHSVVEFEHNIVDGDVIYLEDGLG